LIHRRSIEFSTNAREQLLDLTDEVSRLVGESGMRDGLVHVYARGATAAVMIQENWDRSVPEDAVELLASLIPRGVWQHDLQDGNGDAHLKAGLVGPSETVPVVGGTLALSTWQGIFFCEFDGPRERREVLCTVIGEGR